MTVTRLLEVKEVKVCAMRCAIGGGKRTFVLDSADALFGFREGQEAQRNLLFSTLRFNSSAFRPCLPSPVTSSSHQRQCASSSLKSHKIPKIHFSDASLSKVTPVRSALLEHDTNTPLSHRARAAQSAMKRLTVSQGAQTSLQDDWVKIKGISVLQ